MDFSFRLFIERRHINRPTGLATWFSLDNHPETELWRGLAHRYPLNYTQFFIPQYVLLHLFCPVEWYGGRCARSVGHGVLVNMDAYGWSSHVREDLVWAFVKGGRSIPLEKVGFHPAIILRAAAEWEGTWLPWGKDSFRTVAFLGAG